MYNYRPIYSVALVYCVAGVVGTANVGGYKIIFCDSELEVSSALQVIEKRRRARGYKLTE